jgi:hypothetical protein
MKSCKLKIFYASLFYFSLFFVEASALELPTELPTQLGKIIVDQAPANYATKKREKFPVLDIPIEESYAMWNNFIGDIGEDTLADLTQLHLFQNKVASIVFTFRDPSFHTTKNILTKKFGKGINRKIKGSEACNNIEITTWRGVDTTLMLAVIGGQANSSRVLAFLKLRSNALFPLLRKELDKTPAPEGGECDWLADSALGQP